MDVAAYVLDVVKEVTHTFQDKAAQQAIAILIQAAAVHQEQAGWY